MRQVRTPDATQIGLHICCIKYYKLLFHREIQIPDKFFCENDSFLGLFSHFWTGRRELTCSENFIFEQ